MDRREFVHTGAAVAVATRLPLRLSQADASIKDLCMRALSSAKTAGASYADVRVGRARLRGGIGAWCESCFKREWMQ